MHWINTTLFILLDLQLSESLLLYDDLVLELVILVSLHLNGLSALLELCLDRLGLFRFLSLWQVNRLLDLLLFILSLLLDHVVGLRVHLLRLDVHLQINNFLEEISEDEYHTFWTLSSLRFLRVWISPVRFLASSIFFQVFISSCFNKAIRLASNWASCSILEIIWE